MQSCRDLWPLKSRRSSLGVFTQHPQVSILQTDKPAVIKFLRACTVAACHPLSAFTPQDLTFRQKCTFIRRALFGQKKKKKNNLRCIMANKAGWTRWLFIWNNKGAHLKIKQKERKKVKITLQLTHTHRLGSTRLSSRPFVSQPEPPD